MFTHNKQTSIKVHSSDILSSTLCDTRIIAKIRCWLIQERQCYCEEFLLYCGCFQRLNIFLVLYSKCLQQKCFYIIYFAFLHLLCCSAVLPLHLHLKSRFKFLTFDNDFFG